MNVMSTDEAELMGRDLADALPEDTRDKTMVLGAVVTFAMLRHSPAQRAWMLERLAELLERLASKSGPEH